MPNRKQECDIRPVDVVVEVEAMEAVAVAETLKALSERIEVDTA